jgi:cytidylate kinase
MSVITISREYGSGGAYIAQQVAETLGSHFAGKREIARLLGQQGFAGFSQEYDAVPPAFWTRFDARRVEGRELMVDTLNRLILALAQHGDMVILGRGAFAVLRDFPGSFHVRIQAPLSQRVNWVMEKMNITQPAQAEAMVKEGDRVRAAFVESFYGVRWDVSSGFDMMLDTGKVPLKLAIAWLVEVARALKAGAEGNPPAGTLRIDAEMASLVARELKCQAPHR